MPDIAIMLQKISTNDIARPITSPILQAHQVPKVGKEWCFPGGIWMRSDSLEFVVVHGWHKKGCNPVEVNIKCEILIADTSAAITRLQCDAPHRIGSGHAGHREIPVKEHQGSCFRALVDLLAQRLDRRRRGSAIVVGQKRLRQLFIPIRGDPANAEYCTLPGSVDVCHFAGIGTWALSLSGS